MQMRTRDAGNTVAGVLLVFLAAALVFIALAYASKSSSDDSDNGMPAGLGDCDGTLYVYDEINEESVCFTTEGEKKILREEGTYEFTCYDPQSKETIDCPSNLTALGPPVGTLP